MCIMQRYAFALAVAVAVVAGIHASTGRMRAGYGVVLALLALAGGGVAARQSWIQRFPPDIAECGPGLEYLMESFPLTVLAPMIFRGADDAPFAALDKTMPVLLVGGECDPATNGGRAVKDLARRMRRLGFTDANGRIYAETRHETLNEINRQGAMEDFAAWAVRALAA